MSGTRADWTAPHHTRHSRRLHPSRSRQNLETLRSAALKQGPQEAPGQCTLGSPDVRKNSEAEDVTKRVESEGWKKVESWNVRLDTQKAGVQTLRLRTPDTKNRDTTSRPLCIYQERETPWTEVVG